MIKIKYVGSEVGLLLIFVADQHYMTEKELTSDGEPFKEIDDGINIQEALEKGPVHEQVQESPSRVL